MGVQEVRERWEAESEEKYKGDGGVTGKKEDKDVRGEMGERKWENNKGRDDMQVIVW